MINSWLAFPAVLSGWSVGTGDFGTLRWANALRGGFQMARIGNSRTDGFQAKVKSRVPVRN